MAYPQCKTNINQTSLSNTAISTIRRRLLRKSPSLEPVKDISLLPLVLQAAPLLFIRSLRSPPLSLSILFPRPGIITQEVPEDKELVGDLTPGPVHMDVDLDAVLVQGKREEAMAVPSLLAEVQDES